MADANQQLRQAFTLMKQGNRREAIAIVQSVLKQDRNNASAWWLLANLLDDEDRKRKALDRVLALEPTHKGANEMMDKLAPKVSPFIGMDEAEEEIDLSTPEGRMRPEKLVKSRYIEEEKKETQVPLSIRIGFGLLTIFVLALVVIFGVLPALQGPPPDEVVREYLQVFTEQDYERLREMTCEKDLNQIDMVEQSFGQMEAAVPQGQELSFEFVNLTVEILEENPEDAYLRMTGSLRMTLGDREPLDLPMSQVISSPGLTVEGANAYVIREGGAWKICDP